MTDVAPDGSPVAFYRRLPAMGEPERIHDAAPVGASILDLGCGPGRIAARLLALGHPVTGIDNSPAMVEALPEGVEGIVADAVTMRLGRRWDVVLLASHLVNDPDLGVAFARTARDHVVDDGLVIGEVYPLDWDPVGAVGRVSTFGDATAALTEARLDGTRLTAAVRYEIDGSSWIQPFTAALLDESALAALLVSAHLAFDGWLGRPGWFRARPT
jgi:SAM-dependent methyltransferase